MIRRYPYPFSQEYREQEREKDMTVMNTFFKTCFTSSVITETATAPNKLHLHLLDTKSKLRKLKIVTNPINAYPLPPSVALTAIFKCDG